MATKRRRAPAAGADDGALEDDVDDQGRSRSRRGHVPSTAPNAGRRTVLVSDDEEEVQEEEDPYARPR
jgi:hypothetical protein